MNRRTALLLLLGAGVLVLGGTALALRQQSSGSGVQVTLESPSPSPQSTPKPPSPSSTAIDGTPAGSDRTPGPTRSASPAPRDEIDSFEDCAAAGYPIAESYPEQCFTPDGRGFTRRLQASGVRGMVLFGPVCPVERFPPDPGCAPRPGPASIELRRLDGTLAASGSAGAGGRFSFEAPAGYYRLTASTGSPIGGCAPVEVEIPPERFAETRIDCDTGIR